MRLPGTEYPAGVRPLVIPYTHGLVETCDPSTGEYRHQIIVPRLDHLPYFPDSINIWRGIITCISERLYDLFETVAAHKIVQPERGSSLSTDWLF